MKKITLPLIVVLISTLLSGMDEGSKTKVGDFKSRASNGIYEVTEGGPGTVRLEKYPKTRKKEDGVVFFGKLSESSAEEEGKKEKGLADLRTGKDLRLYLIDLLKKGDNIREDNTEKIWSVLEIDNLNIVFALAEILKKNQPRYSGIICKEGSRGKVCIFFDIATGNKFYIKDIEQIKRKKDTSKKKSESQ